MDENMAGVTIFIVSAALLAFLFWMDRKDDER